MEIFLCFIKEAHKIAQDYKKQATREASKDFGYKAITGHNRNLLKADGSTGYIRGDKQVDGVTGQLVDITGSTIKNAADSFEKDAVNKVPRAKMDKDRKPLEPENGM